MDIYLLRHGQTDGNRARRHQHPNTPLNEVGERQAEEAGDYFSDLPITHMFTSRQQRALTTATIIGKTIDIVPITSDLFEELHRPKYLIGERRAGWLTLKYMFLWYLGYAPASHHDGETYGALRERIREVKLLLAELPSDAKVIIVSHSAFITFFLAHLKSDRPIGLFRAGYLFIKMLLMHNTSRVHIRYKSR